MSNYIGKETKIAVGGKSYMLSRLSRSILREFAEWVQLHTPDPLAICAAHINDFPKDLQTVLLQQAWTDAKTRLDIEGPEVREAMHTMEGGTKLLQLLLRQHHPDLSEDDVFDLAQTYFTEEMQLYAAKLRAQHPELSEEEANRLAVEEVTADGPFRLDLRAMPRD